MGKGQPSLLRITGLCISPDSRLWISTNVDEMASWPFNCAVLTVSKAAAVWLQFGLHAFQLLCRWTIHTHKHWLRLFRAVVRSWSDA